MAKILHETKLRAIGNSTGLILPGDVLEKLDLKQGDTVFIMETEKGKIEITPYDQTVKDTLEVAKDIVHRYRNAFKELAK